VLAYLFLGGGDVEFDVADVAVAHVVILALLSQTAVLLDLGLGAMLLDVGVFVDVHGNEPALHVVVNHAGGFGGLVSRVDGPGTNLIGTAGEEMHEAQGLVTALDNAVKHALVGANVGHVLLSLLIGLHVGQSLLKLRRVQDNVLLSDAFAQQEGHELVQMLVLLAAIILLRQIHQEDTGLGGEEIVGTEEVDLLGTTRNN